MKSEEIKNLFDKFESIACEYDGVEAVDEAGISVAYGRTMYSPKEGV